MRKVVCLAASVAALSLVAGLGAAQASVLTFNDLITGSTNYTFDADGDSVGDVRFTTVDPNGFNTVGPGLNQQFIHEPGLEGTSLLPVDLRVTFLSGALGGLSFGYAVNGQGDIPGALTFSVYNAADTLLSSVTSDAHQGSSSFPEAFVSTSFSGTAAYATFAFDGVADSRFIIDDFAGTFGSSEVLGVPEPGAWALMILGFGAAGAALRRRGAQPVAI